MKVLASDFDGTFYFGKKETKVLPENLSAIRQFQNQGNLFGICTGRSLQGILQVYNQIPYDFFILDSGAIILDSQYHVIYQKMVDINAVRKLRNEYIAYNATQIIHANNTVYVIDRQGSSMQEYVKDFEDIKGDIFGISFKRENLQLTKETVEKINKDYAGVLYANQNGTNVDVAPFGEDKGKALRILKEYLGVKQICGIGDGFNDMCMLKAADVSFTFDYADPEVQQCADYIVKNIAEAIEKI